MCRPSKEGVMCLSHKLNLLSGYRNTSIGISNFLNTDLDLIISQRDVMDGGRPLINSSKGNQAGRFSLTYNLHFSEPPVSGSYPKGSTQLLFVLTRTVEGPTSNSGGSASPYDCICGCIWDYIWFKSNISCRFTFSMIESSSWSLIFCAAATDLREPWT